MTKYIQQLKQPLLIAINMAYNVAAQSTSNFRFRKRITKGSLGGTNLRGQNEPKCRFSQIIADFADSRLFLWKHNTIENLLRILNLLLHTDLLWRPPWADIISLGWFYRHLSSQRRVHSLENKWGHSKNTTA